MTTKIKTKKVTGFNDKTLANLVETGKIEGLAEKLIKMREDLNSGFSQSMVDEGIQKRIEDGTIANLTIIDASITGDKIADNTIPSSKLDDNLIDVINTVIDDTQVLMERASNNYKKIKGEYSDSTVFKAEEDGVLSINEAVNNTESSVGILSVLNNDIPYLSLKLYPTDYIDNNYIYRRWDKYNFKSISFENITFQSNDIYATVKIENFDITDYDCKVTTQNIISDSDKFGGAKQTDYSAIRNTTTFIGTKSDTLNGVTTNYLCINIIKSDVISAGLTWNTDGIKSYLKSLEDFTFHIKRLDYVKHKYPNKYVFMKEKDNVTISSIDIEFQISHMINGTETIFEDSECSYYQAVVNKPFSGDFNNIPVGIKVKFEKGECASVGCIEVYKQTEIIREGSTTQEETTPLFTKLDFQFEEDTNAHDNSIILGNYSDGSVQSGILWVKDSLSDGDNIYFIKIYDKEQNNTYTRRIAPTSDSTDIEVKYTEGNVKCLFNRYMGYNLRAIYIGDRCINDTNLAFIPSIRNSSLVDINLNGGTTTNTNFEIKGNGVIFMDFITKNVFKYNENIESITHYRFWFNGQLDIKSTIRTNDEIKNNVLTGVNFKFIWDGTSDTVPTKIEVGTVYDDYNKCLGILKSTEMSPEYPDKNSYTASLAIGYDDSSSVKSRRLYSMWRNEKLTIPAGSKFGAYYSFKHDSNLSSSNAKTESWKILNPIYSKATKYNKTELKTQLENKLSKYLEYMLDKVMNFDFKNTGHTLFPGAEVFLYLGYMKTHDAKLWDKLEEAKDYLFNTRWGGATTGDELFNRWKNKANAYVGIEYFGRDSAMIPYLYKEYKNKGDNVKAAEILTMLEACADLFVKVEEYCGGGVLYLTVDGNCNTNAQSAAFKCLTKAIELMPSNTKVTTWTTVKNRILTKYLSLIRYGTIIPHTGNADSSTFQPQFHYEAFPSMDYVISVDTLGYNPETRLYEAVTPFGSCREYFYNYYRKRKGFAHTLLYCVGAHALIGNVSGLAEANQIMDFLLSKCYPIGYHQYPLDGWGNEDSSFANFPIECQVVSEILFELDKIK